MSIRSIVTRAFTYFVGASLLVGSPGCVGTEAEGGDPTSDPDEITGANAVGRTLSLNGYVFVEPGASESTILEAIRRQTRTAFGPLREMEISVDDRELRTIDARTLQREQVSVVDTDQAGATPRPMLRVRYKYSSRAVVPRTLSTRRSLSTTVLFGNYVGYGRELIEQCTDNDSHARDFGVSGLWYTFEPELSRCQRAVRSEVSAIDAAVRKLTDRRTQVPLLDVNRRFLPVTVTLATIRQADRARYPEYDQLFGARDPNKTDLNVYAFFGVIGEREENPLDEGYLEMFFVLRNVLRAHPTARFVTPSPTTNLLDLRVNGRAVPDATYPNVINWALTGRGPSGFTATDLRREIQRVWRTRYINVDIPLTVRAGSVSHPLTVHIHAYYGDEGSAFSSQARARYVAAWRDADVFAYSGHSHIGSGPLDPANYRPSDFPDRYQIMMINSCVSYNYYNRDFYNLHPGGSRKLEMIINGIEAYSDNGHAVSTLITGLLNGRQQSYLSLLRSMIANEPDIGLHDYDPLRVVDGEQDNTYTPSSLAISLAPRN